ncbi:MAG TPA: threonylcarbamoyl-AMP synthase [Candidatus Nealsonbacteria bacterium]|uniref:L-threonylcarbamoyladenylate synthase n=1 Tax=marine sediment metagenome TaxID=412755 RepID=A0A0F9UJM7_9ZZZZ|nr:threonylcarbamoyl-AMP synthase [Candidatus Nealsonbacteria bacterium]HEB46424.1 threonylcarbamoyl-AMP synthase [Candidatus Nealsonbacteria bacterium]
MQTIKINLKKIEKEKLISVINLLKQGRVIIFPTDTVYIPVADATSRKAVKKVFQIKQRSPKNPIPIFVKNIEAAKKIAKINKVQEKFLETVWPGRVTVVLKRLRTSKNSVRGNKKTKMRIYGVAKNTIALRIPDLKPMNFLLKKLDIPLVGTSANISGKPASGNIKEVLRQFKRKEHQPDLIIDAGNLAKSKPSIVLDLTTSPPKIIRS